MKNLFNFSKIVAILLPILFAIRMLSLLFLPENILKIIGEIYGYSIFFTWLIWFSLIITASVKKSPLKTPAILGIIGYLAVILYSLLYPLFNISSEDLVNQPLITAVNAVVQLTKFILFTIALCWICKYFKEKPKVKTLAILIVLFPILLFVVRFCINVCITPRDIDHLKSIYLYADLIILSLQVVLYSYFFLEFYKISKCKDNTFIKALTLDKES